MDQQKVKHNWRMNQWTWRQMSGQYPTQPQGEERPKQHRQWPQWQDPRAYWPWGQPEWRKLFQIMKINTANLESNVYHTRISNIQQNWDIFTYAGTTKTYLCALLRILFLAMWLRTVWSQSKKKKYFNSQYFHSSAFGVGKGLGSCLSFSQMVLEW